MGCGARTGFDEELSSMGETTSSGGGAASTARESGPFCAFNVGPVASCDAGVSAGSVQRCGAVNHYCIDVGGHWGCCSSPSHNNGAGGVCTFPLIDFCE
jgi:hypothetical protein